jgi:hypothetical protein
MDFMNLLYGLSLGKDNRGNVTGRAEIGEYIVDTCDTMDCGYETGICKNNNWIIVEYYEDENEASVGHKKWCEFVNNNPSEVYSVQSEEIEKF